MNQLPGNSQHARREPEEPKKVEKVVTGEVVVRKRSYFRRTVDSFFAGRADVAADFVIHDVLLPAAKATITDGASSFIDRLVNGDRRNTPRIPGQTVGQYGNSAPTNYNRVGNPIPGAPQNQQIMTRQARANHDFSLLVFGSRVEAEAVIDAMFQHVQLYNAVTVAALYEMCDLTGNYTDDKYGWTDIRGAGVIPARGGGFILDLPRPIPLD